MYELNILSRRLLIEPNWTFPFEANGNKSILFNINYFIEDGDFEVSLQFGDLIVQEKGKKKQEVFLVIFVYLSLNRLKKKQL